MTVPIRTCAGCRRRDEQPNLVRYVLVDGAPTRDDARRRPGRGAWLHDDEACFASALKTGFSRSFRQR